MTTELEVVPGRATQIQPLDVGQTRQMMDAYQAGLSQIVDDTDWQEFRTKKGDKGRFLKKSGWRKIATWFGLDLELLQRTVDRDDDGRMLRAYVVARAVAPNGRHADGDGACSLDEGGFTKPEQDIPATAATRATNRAISNLVGMGATSAEELDAQPAGTAGSKWGVVLTDDDALARTAGLVTQIAPGVDGPGFITDMSRYFDGVPEACARMLQGLAKAANPVQQAADATAAADPNKVYPPGPAGQRRYAGD